MEVLLHISVSTIARLGGLLRHRREEGVEILNPADTKAIAHIDRFLGGAWWQEHFAPIQSAGDEERATDVALRVADLFMEKVRGAAGYRAVNMPLQRRPDHLPKYVLVLFTRHGDGLWCFADALGKAGREWEGAWRTEVASEQLIRAEKKYASPGLFDLAELFAPEPFDASRYEEEHRAEWEGVIETNIRNLLAAEGPFVLTNRIVDVYGTVLGAASERHVKAAVRTLHSTGEVVNNTSKKNFFREQIRPVN